MKHLGIEVPVKNVPEQDPGFLHKGKFCTAFLKDAKKPLDIAVERAGGEVAVYKTFIHGTPDMAEADIYYVDRIIKMLLWMKGGFKVYLRGDQAVYEAMKATYRVGGARAFDADFMSNVYEKPFEVVYCDQVPAEKSNPQAVGRCRRLRPQGVRRHRRRAGIFRGGGLVPQDHLRPQLPL